MKKMMIAFSIGPLLLLLIGGYTFVNSTVTYLDVQDEKPVVNGLIGKKAPELSEGEWVNAPPQNLSDYEGKVVLLEFWTYGCYNCRNTIPKMNEWQKKYASKDFAMIGVHTPEFSPEKDLANVSRQVAHLGIRYAVVTDNEYQTWDAYHQQYWPTMYLIDKKGIVRHIQIGEGNYEQTERIIHSLIREEEKI